MPPAAAELYPARPLRPSQLTILPAKLKGYLHQPSALIRYIFNKTLEQFFAILLVITNLSRYNHDFITRKIKCPHLDNLTSTF